MQAGYPAPDAVGAPLQVAHRPQAKRDEERDDQDQFTAFVVDHAPSHARDGPVFAADGSVARDGETEFMTISYWESIEAMSSFAGQDPRRIHHLPRDAEFLIELPESVQILEIRQSHGI